MPRPTAGSAAENPRFFASSRQLRDWLTRNHASGTELWVGLHKKGTGKPSITWPELVDQLLCFGWIDGVRKSLGERSYVIRATPRKRGSNWSAVNLRRMTELIESGAVEPAGFSAYEARDAVKSHAYSFERENVTLGSALEARFKQDRRAWSFFSSQPPSYRRTATWWVVSAKREETRRRRLETLIKDSAAGQRIALLRKQAADRKP